MKNNKLVSICTPCYNHEDYLDDYFKGIINQTYDNLELVITDDCSSDASVSLIERYIPVLSEKGINVLFEKHSANKGITISCNELIKRSNGEYIKLCASDDILCPNCISEMMDYMAIHPEAKILIANTCMIENDYHYGDPCDEIRLMDFQKIRSYGDLHEKLFESSFLNAPGEFFKKTLFDIYGLFDESLLYEDWDFFLRITESEQIHFLDKILVLYRKSITSISQYDQAADREHQRDRFEKMYLGTRDLFRKHKGEIADEKWKECFLKRYRLFLGEADDLGYYDAITKIFNDMREDGINDYSFRQRLAYAVKHKAPGLFRLIKKVI